MHWYLVATEIILFIAASLCAYLSQTGAWAGFVVVTVVATLLFAIVKVVDAVPAAMRLLVREDFASQIADEAGAYGVREYFNMQSARGQAARNDKTREEIERATSLWLCANSGASYLDPAIYRHWQFIEARLRAGVEFRVVLLDPLSGERKLRNQINVVGEQIDSKINLANLIRLHNLYPGLELRFASHGMHATVFATDHCLFFDPYQLGVVGGRIENRSFALRIEREDPAEGVGFYMLFKSHFDTIWRSGTSFQDWMAAAGDRLPGGLPVLRAR